MNRWVAFWGTAFVLDMAYLAVMPQGDPLPLIAACTHVAAAVVSWRYA